MKFRYKHINIHYVIEGNGSTVVLLHGFLENYTMWSRIIPVLAQSYKVIAIDLLGHGQSDNLSYIHTMEDQATMVKALLDHLKLRRYSLIGHSLGGYIVLAFAELYPKNIKKLCLMNSTALEDSVEKQKNRERAIAMVKQNKETFIKMAIPNLFAPKSKISFKELINQIKQEALTTSLQGVIASLEGMKIRKNRTHVLQCKLYKKLFIIGKEDPLLNYDSLLEQTKHSDTEIAIFSKGHMSHIENHNELILVLIEFLKK